MDNREQNVRKQRPRMSRQQRAKQFAPFQAVNGLTEALAAKEAEHMARVNGQTIKVSIEDAEQNTIRNKENK